MQCGGGDVTRCSRIKMEGKAKHKKNKKNQLGLSYRNISSFTRRRRCAAGNPVGNYVCVLTNMAFYILLYGRIFLYRRLFRPVNFHRTLHKTVYVYINNAYISHALDTAFPKPIIASRIENSVGCPSRKRTPRYKRKPVARPNTV